MKSLGILPPQSPLSPMDGIEAEIDNILTTKWTLKYNARRLSCNNARETRINSGLNACMSKTLPFTYHKKKLPDILGLVSALVYLCIFSSGAIHEL